MDEKISDGERLKKILMGYGNGVAELKVEEKVAAFPGNHKPSDEEKIKLENVGKGNNNDNQDQQHEDYVQLGYFDYKFGVPMNGINNDSYTILELLGMGTYGQVFKAHDKKKNHFALKILRSNDKFHIAGLLELKVLEELTRLDPKQNYVFSQLLCKFNLDNHVCFGQKLLGMSLEAFWNQNSCYQFPIYQIRHIMYQLAHTLSFLHANKFVHADIKLNNILFVDSSYDEIDIQGFKYLLIRNTRVCLIDYGITRYGADEYKGSVVSRAWRAPEIFFKKPWNTKIDIWSLGCALYKLFTGYHLFAGETELDHLALVEMTLGKFPESLIKSEFGEKHFKNGFIDISKLTQGRVLALEDEAENIKESLRQRLGDIEVRDLIDLLLSMLNLCPSERISATDVMSHKFVDKLTTTEKLRHGICNEGMMVHEESGVVSGIDCSCNYCDNYLKGVKLTQQQRN